MRIRVVVRAVGHEPIDCSLEAPLARSEGRPPASGCRVFPRLPPNEDDWDVLRRDGKLFYPRERVLAEVGDVPDVP